MRNYRLGFVVAVLCVASFASFTMGNEVSAASRRTTKPKRTTTRKPVATKPIATIVPTSTLVVGATELDVRNAAIKDAYEQYKALYVKIVENKTTSAVVPTTAKTILTGQAFLDAVRFERTVLALGLYFENTRFESIDFRIDSSSSTSAVFRVCERISDTGARKKTDNSVATNPVPMAVNDRQYDLVYSPDAKRWFISLAGRFNDEVDKSKCADGK